MRADAARALAAGRLVAVPAALLANRLADADRTDALFWPLLALTAVWALATVAAARRDRRPPARAGAALDVALLTGLVVTSGGPFSSLAGALFVVPLTAALVARPRGVAVAGAGVLLAWALGGLAYELTHGGDAAVGEEVTEAVLIVWATVIAVVLRRVLERRERRLDELVAGRRRLVRELLAAEERERRRLADALHDETVQSLLAARQELGAREPDLPFAREALDEAVRRLRGTLADLHPQVLRHAGLAAALRVLAEGHARRGLEVRVDVDAGAEGVHDELLHAVARELLQNVVKHAGARSASVALRRAGDELRLRVEDDGAGIAPGAADRAPLAGHLGLASCAERVEAAGGRFAIGPRPGGGTRAEAVLPAVPAAYEAAPAPVNP